MSGLTAAGTEMAPGTEVVVDVNLIVDVEDSCLLLRQVMVETVPNPGRSCSGANRFYGRLPQESVPEDQQLGISMGEETDRVGEARLPLLGVAHILHRVSEPLDRLRQPAARTVRRRRRSPISVSHPVLL
jgi:hypothetical protein